jgi:Tfp pilus assembly protein FimT
MLMVFVIMALLVAFSLPKFAVLQERSRLTSARQELEAAIATARAAAIQQGRTARVRFYSNQVQVLAVSSSSGTTTTVMPAMPLDSVYGVTLSASDTAIVFDSRGFASPRLGATGVFTLIGKNARRDSVCVTTAGQIMPRKCSL